MLKGFLRIHNILIFLGLSGLLISCTSSRPFDGGTAASTQSSYSGYIVVTTVATDPTTGPGIVTLFKADGTYVMGLRDLYPSSEWSGGTSFLSPDRVIISIANGTRIEEFNLTTRVSSNFATARISGNPNRSFAQDTVDNTFYLGETSGASSTIEKYDSNGSPIGAPFIASTVGSCTLNTPTGIAFIPSTQNIAVVQSTKLNIYNKSGGCVSAVTAAPFNSNAPYAIAYHAATDKLLVAFATNSNIYACSTSGTGCSQIYVNTSIVSTPRAITVDASGAIYIGSSGTDTIEKFTWDGVGTLTHVGAGSFIGPGIYTQNPTSIMVIP
jgi:hypothetical protein